MVPTDGQLVEQVREGDREAFGALVDRYRSIFSEADLAD
jgi:hypothetical protein